MTLKSGSGLGFIQLVCSLERSALRTVRVPQCCTCSGTTSDSRQRTQVTRRVFCSATLAFLTQPRAVVVGAVDALTEVQIEEIAPGNGPSAVAGSRVSVRWVLRRSNGYYVSSNSGFNNRFDELTYTVGSGFVIAGFEQGMAGIKAGGRRRFIVPASLGYVKGVQVGSPGPIPDDSAERRALKAHSREKLYFEVLCTKVRTQ